jgi:hypothetical protein
MKNETSNTTEKGNNDNLLLCTVPLQKDIILEYFKKKTPDYRFVWHRTERWVAKYETVNSLHKALNIPKSTIYKSLKQLKGTEGFYFQQQLISYEYRVE